MTRYSLVRLTIGLALTIGAAIASELASSLLQVGLGAGRLLSLLTMSLRIGFVVGAYWSYVRWIEKRPVSEFGLPGAVAEVGQGVMLATLLSTGVFSVLWAIGAYSITGTNGWTVALPVLYASVATAFVEETIIRGVFFRILEGSLGTWLAVAISGTAFGALHLQNQHATVLGAVSIALTAGVLLAAGFVLTRRLWLPIGLHFGWNFLEGGVFGAEISGGKAGGFLQAKLSGPETISGGAFGPEASIVTLVLGLAMGLAMLWVANRRGVVLRPFWRPA